LVLGHNLRLGLPGPFPDVVACFLQAGLDALQLLVVFGPLLPKEEAGAPGHLHLVALKAQALNLLLQLGDALRIKALVQRALHLVHVALLALGFPVQGGPLLGLLAGGS